MPSVIAVLVARNGGEYLPRTIAALRAQTRPPDEILVIDASSSDDSGSILSAAFPGQLTTTPGRVPFVAAVATGLQLGAPPAVDDQWLWLLGHDNAPDPGALAALLGAVEVAPSVAIAGPKLMRWDDASIIAGFGETLTGFGRSIRLAVDELDQAQHDVQADQLGVAAAGMLVRRQVYSALGGFDRGLPSVDAGLDLSLRARLAGHRVIGVPTARVASAGPPELFGRRSVSVGAQNRIRRSAQLHRRMAYAPPLAVPLHWLTLVPLAVVRSLGHVIAKRPGAVGGELAAGIGAAFDGSVPSARENIRRTRRVRWSAIAPLRMPWAEVRELRAAERAAAFGAAAAGRERPGFFVAGGAWVVLLAAVAGAFAFGRFVDAAALAGGGLIPLSSTVPGLWSHVGYGWHDLGAGFLGPSDPFAAVLAVLGTLTFWNPSFSIVLLYLLALPLAALTAWFCAARFSVRGWAPGIAALVWAVSPPFLASLDGGHLGAVIAHILLPALVLAVVSASRSWPAAAIAGLLFAVVAASAPVLVPALVVGIVAMALARPLGAIRVIGTLIPAAALFGPLVVEQLRRGNWIALLAEPGAPVLATPASGLQLAVGSTDGGYAGWTDFLTMLGLPGAAGPWVLAALVAPLAVLALVGLVVRGTKRSVPSMVLALLGFVTAVAATHIAVSIVGETATPIWAAPGLSLYWIGLLGSATVAIEVLSRRAALPALVVGVAAIVAAVPLLTAAAAATSVQESSGRILPAFVNAETANRQGLGTLELTAQPSGAIAVDVHRGPGTTLDERSTLATTGTAPSAGALLLADLAGNISSRSGFDIAGTLDDLQIGFVLVPPTSVDSADAIRQRIVEALDGNRLLTPIGQTSVGFLWQYEGLADGEAPSGPGPLGTQVGLWIVIGLAVVFGLTLLLAIPTQRRRRVRSAKAMGAGTEIEDTTDDSSGDPTADRPRGGDDA